jgi:gliding motility-associated-like protein
MVANATHNRGGEIIYRHIGGFTYEVTIKTYTKTSSPADRDWLPLFWGDGTPRDSIERSETTFYTLRDAQENIYTKQHTYPGGGEYSICVTDPNRNFGVLNISNSILQLFSLNTILRISSSQAPNNSVYFTNLPLQDACIFQPWVYNAGAVDADGDNLVYTLVQSQGGDCEPFPEGTYVFPDAINAPGVPFPNPENQISINPQTGTIIWDSPQRSGEYNIAFLVEEYRNGIFVGSVLRDMQIVVKVCDNLPPVIADIPDTCVEAGSNVSFNVTADDPDGDNIQLSAFGGPFEVSESPALFSQTSLLAPVTGTFSWNTRCSHVRLASYQLTFEALDFGQVVSLVDVGTSVVTVVAPAPENLVAEATGAGIFLDWDQSFCTQATGYKVYRRINPFGFVPGPCETGVPEYTGYEFLAAVDGLGNTSFVDMDEVVFGREVCYMVVACFIDGAESYASNETCAQIRFEIPIIKKNSIGTTAISGRDTVQWRSPVELNIEIFPGPYQYRLLRGDGFAEVEEFVWESQVAPILDDLETEWISPSINTIDTAHTYRVELYSDGQFAGRANLAASLFIELIPNDNELEMTWKELTPWINFEYDIYRKGPNDAEFSLIATIDTLGFKDHPLVNNLEYCYYIVSRGSYFAIGETDTLINYSQQRCEMPYDRTPPCAPQLDVNDNCEDLTVDMEWSNPNIACPETDDTRTYHLYFAPTEDSPFTLIAVLEGEMNTAFNFMDTLSIAGCYAVTALDSLAPWPDGELRRNESEFSNVVCIDNCPEYSLPNVFTPNNDGINDVFEPFPYRSVASVEMTIFNRWGGIVFQTTDPNILWDGTNKDTGELVSAATYFYTCKVFTIRLSGIVPINLASTVQVYSRSVLSTD